MGDDVKYTINANHSQQMIQLSVLTDLFMANMFLTLGNYA